MHQRVAHVQARPRLGRCDGGAPIALGVPWISPTFLTSDCPHAEIASYDLPLSTLDVSGELEDPSEASRRHAKAVRMVLNVPGGLVLITDDEHMVCLRWGAKGAPVKAWVRSEWQALLPKDVPPVFADLPAPVPPVSGAQGLLPAWLHPSEWKRMQDWVEMQVLGLRKSVQPLK